MESFSLATRDKINTKIVYYFFMIGVELVYGLNKKFSGLFRVQMLQHIAGG
jgi:hypothetical protein